MSNQVKVPTENEVRNGIVKYLLFHGWLVLRINSGAATPERADGTRGFVPFNRWQALGEDEYTVGISDLLAFKDGVYLAIETKRPGNRPTEAQKRFMQTWAEHGGVWCVAESIESVEMALSQ